MTKEEFKERWDSNINGGGITFEDVANCAKEWGLCSTPRVHQMHKILNKVLIAAGCEYDCVEEDEEED